MEHRLTTDGTLLDAFGGATVGGKEVGTVRYIRRSQPGEASGDGPPFMFPSHLVLLLRRPGVRAGVALRHVHLRRRRKRIHTIAGEGRGRGDDVGAPAELSVRDGHRAAG